MENPWNDIFMAVTQKAELVAGCYECEEIKPVMCLIFLNGEWSFLCEECFEKNYMVRLADGTGFDLTKVEAKINE